MASRYNVVLSDRIDREFDRVAEETEQTKSEILRKALGLYIFAHDGQKRGLKLGLAERDEQLKTEVFGL